MFNQHMINTLVCVEMLEIYWIRLLVNHKKQNFKIG